MFLKNQWYAAFWSSDLMGDAVLSRTIAEEEIVFWRDDDGKPCATEDCCPHRLAPLSRGRRVNGGIQCGYHGVCFDGKGRCIANPHGPKLASLAVRAYPVIERYKLLWVWLGDAALADPARLPDLDFSLDVPETAYISGYLNAQAGHQLICDNILDLTHTDYLHPDTLGGGSVTRARPKIEERPDGSVFIEWFAGNEEVIPLFRAEMDDPDLPTDMWTSVIWNPNGVMVLRFGLALTGRPRESGLDTRSAHIATPESYNSTHYFFFNVRDFRVDDPVYNQRMGDGLRNAFTHEDMPMIEAQQRILGDADLFDRKPALLSTDAASTRARRLYARQLNEERTRDAVPA